MAKFGSFLLAFVLVVGACFAGGGGSAQDDALIQGKSLSYWLKALKNPDSLTREEAIVVLGGAGEAARGAAPALAELLKDKSAAVRVKAALALGQFKGQAKIAAPVVLEAWKDGTPTFRQQILPALGPLALEDEG